MAGLLDLITFGKMRELTANEIYDLSSGDSIVYQALLHGIDDHIQDSFCRARAKRNWHWDCVAGYAHNLAELVPLIHTDSGDAFYAARACNAPVHVLEWIAMEIWPGAYTVEHLDMLSTFLLSTSAYRQRNEQIRVIKKHVAYQYGKEDPRYQFIRCYELVMSHLRAKVTTAHRFLVGEIE